MVFMFANSSFWYINAYIIIRICDVILSEHPSGITSATLPPSWNMASMLCSLNGVSELMRWFFVLLIFREFTMAWTYVSISSIIRGWTGRAHEQIWRNSQSLRKKWNLNQLVKTRVYIFSAINIVTKNNTEPITTSKKIEKTFNFSDVSRITTEETEKFKKNTSWLAKNAIS